MSGSKSARIKRFLKRGFAKGREVVSGRGTVTAFAEEVTVSFEDASGASLGTQVIDGGQTVLAAARKAGIDLDYFCGGQCSCGTCKVVVQSGADALSAPAGNEQMVLGQSGLSSGSRLACQARVAGDVRVQIPRWF